MTKSVRDKILDGLKDKKSDKTEKVYYTANFDGLVDLVLNDGDIKFLTSNGELSSEVDLEGKVYVPPNKSDLDYLIPKAQTVLNLAKDHSDLTDYQKGCPSCLNIYNKCVKYQQQFSELPNKYYQDLLVLWVFHTYLIEKFVYSPIIYFYAVKERGKTITSKAMIYLARRGIMTETLRESNLIRWGRDHKASLLFDVKDFPKKVDRNQAEDLIYGRFERGVIASRVLYPEKGPFRDTVRFEVFGPTIVTSNKIVDDVGESRCIVMNMKPTKKIFNISPKPKLALELKEALTAARLAHFDTTFKQVEKKRSGRLEDVLVEIHAMVNTLFPSKENNFLELKKLITEQKKETASDSFQARILQIVIDLVEEVEKGSSCLIYEIICDDYNAGKPENVQLDPRTMGSALKEMGFTSKRNSEGAKRGIFYDLDLIKQLQDQYGLEGHPSTRSEKSEESETPDEEIDTNNMPF